MSQRLPAGNRADPQPGESPQAEGARAVPAGDFASNLCRGAHLSLRLGQGGSGAEEHLQITSV